jgi:ABC-2 type transport system permease protein
MSTSTTTTRPTPTAAPGDDQPEVRERTWLLVARREVLTKLTDRSFLIGTLITVLLIVGFVGWQIWNDGRTETYTVAATAEAAPTADLLAERGPDVDEELRVEVVGAASSAEAEQLLRDGDVDVVLRADADGGWTLLGEEEVPDDLTRAATTVVRESVLAANARSAGTSTDELLQGSEVGTSLLDGDAERKDFADLMGFALAFLFYVAALGFGFTLAGSVVEEKSNRIVEIIATKIPVRQLLIGKIAGNTLLAIGQTALILAIGLVGISFTQYAEFVPALSEGIGWFAAFFVVGFCFIACWWAVAGALASRAEDLQTTATPLSMLMLTVFFASFLLDGSALVVASFIPPFSCVLMPIRLLAGEAAVWEPFLAIAVLVAAMGATVVLAERLYRRALLQTQGRVGLRQAWTTVD